MMFSSIIVASITLSGVVLGRPEYLTEHALALTCDNFDNNTVLPTWAGVMLEPPPADQHFITAVGTFSIPSVSGSDGDAASAWVGIGSPGTIFQAGVNLEMRNGEPLYTAWTEWFPDNSHPITDFAISVGDSIKVTIEATSPTEGTATIDNLTTAKSITVSASAPSSKTLQGCNAEWIVENFDRNGGRPHLVEFGTVTFTEASAITNTQNSVDLTKAKIIKMDETGNIVTTINDKSSATIKQE